MIIERRRFLRQKLFEESPIFPFDPTQGKLAPTFTKVTVGKQDDIVIDEFF